MLTDCNFPIIKYLKNESSYERGLKHGKLFKEPIKELVKIRTNLMLEKAPHLKPVLNELALAQATISRSFDESLFDEMKGIADGAEISITDIVILNNYTDFRDIELPEEGCSTVHVQHNNSIFAGQTWDMHKTAKNYMCLIDIEANEKNPATVVLTLVGCLGLMGVNQHKVMIGVNNINTKNARSGLIWPILVRSLLKEKDFGSVEQLLKRAPVTSGHNYIVSHYSEIKKMGAHFEVSPNFFEKVSEVNNCNGHAFHTNHCLGPNNKSIEIANSTNSTTHIRSDLIENKIKNIYSLNDLILLLTDHENYPKSICSHFENGSQDPSYTCAGGAMNLENLTGKFWRGCKLHDKTYQEYSFSFENNKFLLVNNQIS